MKRFLLTPALAALLLLTAASRHGREIVRPAQFDPQDPPFVVQTYPLNQYCRDLDGQWQGSIVGSDGNVYFASSTHSARHGAMVFRFDPRTKKLTPLCDDITRVCGEDPAKTPPQGKIHSDFSEANGWIYFGTHLANYWPEAEDAYPGGHVVGCEMATGKFRDYGVIRAGCDLYSGLMVDPPRKLAYVFTFPYSSAARAGTTHLYRLDLESGRKQDLGSMQKHASSFHIFVDRRGDCWLTQDGSTGNLYRVRAGTDQITVYENALPPRYQERTDALATNQSSRSWRWGQSLGDGDRYLFTIGGGRLWMFDSSKFDEHRREAFTPVHHIGSTGLDMTYANGRVYYIQRANGRRGPKGGDLHLHSVTVGTDHPLVTDYGRIVDSSGRIPWRLEGMSADGKGHVFLTGDWRLLDGEPGTLRHVDGKGSDAYYERGTGQFFAMADVSGKEKK